MAKCLIGLTLLLLLACSPAFAESSTPTPTPRPPAPTPVNVGWYGGLEYPDDAEDPGPYLWGYWDTPPDVVDGIGIEIYDKNGGGRPRKGGVTGTEVLWVWYEKDRLERAGCSIGKIQVILSADCLDRYRNPPSPYRPFPKGFIKAGMKYKIRVGFYAENHSPRTSWSGIHRVTIPKPSSGPTPTPKPAPRPTPTPDGSNESQVERLFKEHPALEQIWYRNNAGQSWTGYVRGNSNYEDLKSLQKGRPYYVVVNKTTTVKGHRLYCKSGECINFITW